MKITKEEYEKAKSVVDQYRLQLLSELDEVFEHLKSLSDISDLDYFSFLKSLKEGDEIKVKAVRSYKPSYRVGQIYKVKNVRTANHYDEIESGTIYLRLMDEEGKTKPLAVNFRNYKYSGFSVSKDIIFSKV